jgi:murein DD-endopeptidase MepM/ murein hydrolase activator NlpD
MKKNSAPSHKGVKGERSSKFTALTCVIVLILASILFPFDVYAARVTSFGALSNTTFFQAPSIIEEYIEGLQKNGYMVDSYKLDLESLSEQRPALLVTNKEAHSKALIDNLDVIVSGVQVTFDKTGEVYTFKNNQECEAWIAELYAVKDLGSYTITDIKQDYSTITSTETLAKKIADVTTEKEKEEQERKAAQEAAKKKKYQVTSRGSSLPRVSSYAFPLQSYSYVSSEYGPRWGTTHTGIDFAAPAGTHIYSWRSGTVTFAGWSGDYGNFIIVDHGDGFVTRYAHCSKIAVTKGQTVSQGQVIGYVGTTGNSTGNHLHFEVKINGNFVNPRNYLSI